MTEREKFIILIANEPLKRADAIILLEGDGYFRVKRAAELYKQGWSRRIVVSGGISDLDNGSFPDLAPRLKLLGVADQDIIIENNSKHTREQAINVMLIVKQNKWDKIILVASHYHQCRAFLTFLKAMDNAKLKIQIINAPAGNLPWFAKNKWGTRFELLESEFEKIELYREKGHIASYADAIEYQQWKEQCGQ